MKQSELINQMSPNDLKKSLIVSQMFFLMISIVLSFIFFEHISNWLFYFELNGIDILYYGVIPGILIVTIDLVLMRFLPRRYYDDGGINEKVFKNRTTVEIFYLALIIAVSEELLFRGVIQTTFGYVIASTIFALAHFRYLKKPVLLVSVLLLSFYIGYLFEITGNLLVTISAHFIIDFLLGLIIRNQKWGAMSDK